MTGAENIPAGGFDQTKVPKIEFVDDVGRLPYANTCGLSLELPPSPKLMDPETGVPFLAESLQGTEGFGQV